jgi:hypothetical protein
MNTSNPFSNGTFTAPPFDRYASLFTVVCRCDGLAGTGQHSG